MTAPDEPNSRRVIPRWREAAASTETGEGRSSRPAVQTEEERGAARRSLSHLQGEFADEPNIGTAAELVSVARMLGAPERAEDAADFLLMHSENTFAPVLRDAREILGLQTLTASEPAPVSARLSVDTLGVEVGMLRTRIRAFPFNPLTHLDLARLFTALGKDEQAERHLKVALGLAPRHRLTLRAVTRFLIHRGEPERALRLLRSLDVVRHDPWLMATEISTATVAGRPQQLVRTARTLLDSNHYPALHISELAASLATLEVLDGGVKKVRQLMRRAFEDPTENTLAQARWVGRRVKLDQSGVEAREVPRNFEARAWQAYFDLDFETSRALFVDWLRDEPFSSRPALMAGYLADLINPTPTQAIELTRVGVRADAHDAGLRNNLAFFLASAGELDKAEAEVAAALRYQGTPDEAPITATRGFIAFRRGDLERGEQFYREAIRLALTQRNEVVATAAHLYFAREAFLNDLPDARALLDEALKAARARPHADLVAIVSRIGRDFPPALLSLPPAPGAVTPGGSAD